MKGIILAGGAGTRLRPLTQITSKQLLPIYNQPMIFFPLQTLLKAGIKEILVIVAPERAGDFLRLLGSGKEFGCKFTYEIQDQPNGIAQAFKIGENFLGKDNVTLILGDNIFEDDFSQEIRDFKTGGKVFAKEVTDPERFGVVEFDANHHAMSIEEKPKVPKSNFAVTGLYVYDHTVVERTNNLVPSARGELEVTDLNNAYLQAGQLEVAFVHGQWFDTGTFESLFAAAQFAREKNLLEKNKS